jgi:hypothetical protein
VAPGELEALGASISGRDPRGVPFRKGRRARSQGALRARGVRAISPRLVAFLPTCGLSRWSAARAVARQAERPPRPGVHAEDDTNDRMRAAPHTQPPPARRNNHYRAQRSARLSGDDTRAKIDSGPGSAEVVDLLSIRFPQTL